MNLRLKAFSIHLLCSLAIGMVVLVVVFGVWYPAPLYLALGVTSVFLLLLLVDITLGPLLTLVVYKPGKKTLKFDLAVIALLQLSALTYGVWAMAQGRPAWVVFNVDRFDVVQAMDVDPRRLSEAPAIYQSPAWTGPSWISAVRPATVERRNEVLFESAQGGSDIAQRPELYRPLVDAVPMMKNKALGLDLLAALNDAAAVASTLEKWPQATGWLPLMARKQPMVVLLTADNSEVLTVVPLQPWPQ